MDVPRFVRQIDNLSDGCRGGRIPSASEPLGPEFFSGLGVVTAYNIGILGYDKAILNHERRRDIGFNAFLPDDLATTVCPYGHQILFRPTATGKDESLMPPQRVGRRCGGPFRFPVQLTAGGIVTTNLIVPTEQQLITTLKMGDNG